LLAQIDGGHSPCEGRSHRTLARRAREVRDADMRAIETAAPALLAEAA